MLAFLLLALPTSGVSGAGAGSTRAAAPPSHTAQGSAVGESKARAAYGQLPLAFVPNAGQTDPRVRFAAQAGGASFFFTQKEAVFSFVKGKKGVVLRLAFLGANLEARIEGQKRGPGEVNYLLGTDPSEWKTDLPTYEQVVYRELWRGIDLGISGAGGALKYEFRLAPGAKVSDIRLAYRGADSLSLGPEGELTIRTPVGRLRDDRPRSYQVIDGRQVAVESRFVLERGTRTYGFALGAYDGRRPLVIDPGLVYSTFVGGSGGEYGWSIALDAGRNAYVTGTVHASGFPTTTGAFQTTFGGDIADAFVTKLNAAGSALAYSTYLGGSSGDESFRIAVDAEGSAYVTGQTSSTNFPTTAGAFQTTLTGPIPFPNGAFVTKLNATGSALAYSTYLEGSGDDEGLGIAVDTGGSAYVTGQTSSVNFPITAGAFQTVSGDWRRQTADAFVTKVNPSGSALTYSSFLGGTGGERGFDIAIGADGSAYVTGDTVEPATPWLERGDVFVAASSQDTNSYYKIYSNSGNLRATLQFVFPVPDVSRGCSLNAANDKLYATSFSADRVLVIETRFMSLVSTINTSVQGGGSPESIAFASNGDFYVGHAGGNRDIQRYNAAGVFQQNYDVATDASGSDWIDLAADQETIHYTSEGTVVKRYDVATSTQLADFAALPADGPAHALRLLPPGDGSGGLLVAQTANVKRLGGSGTVVQTYDASGEDQWFSLSLDPNGTSFWAGSLDTGNFYRFNIASGAVEVGPINAGSPNGNTPGGICLASTTLKEDFPTTSGAFQTTYGGGNSDFFVTKVNPSGGALVYSSYLGGSGLDRSTTRTPSIAVDGAGSAYLTGNTNSTNFPTTPGAFQPAFGGGFGDAFVTKVNATGSALAYSSYLGGSSVESGIDIAVDADGIAYVTGGVSGIEGNFPTTAGAFQTTYGGNGDAFLTKVNAAGSGLSYSTYLGGCQNDVGNGIAVDALGAVYVGGATVSTTFPTTSGSFQPVFGGFQDAFVTKLDPAPVAQPFVPDCTQPPPTPGTIVVKKTTDPSGSSATFQFSGDAAGTIGDGQTIVVSGLTPGTYRSTEAPTTGWRLTGINCDDSDSSGDLNARTATFRVAAGETVTCTFTNRQPPPGPPPGCGVVYSTYLGGAGNDGGGAVHQPGGTILISTSASVSVDSNGNAYVAGETSSIDFPTTTGAFQIAPGGGSDVFVTKLNAAGSAPVYSTYLGGSGADTAGAIAVDGDGIAYVTGSTSSTNFPTTAGAFQTAFGGSSDAFVTKLDASGSALAYSTYLGGSLSDRAFRIALGGDGTAYITGATSSTNFPTTASAFQTAFGGVQDAFVAKVNASGSALVYSSFLGGSGSESGSDIAVGGDGSAYLTGVAGSGFPITAGAFQTTSAGGSDAFVTKVNPSGSALAYSSYLGGSSFDRTDAVAVGDDGSAYLTGNTNSTNFPTTAGAFQTAFGGGTDAFVTKVNASGSALAYSSYVGGSGFDFGHDIVVDGGGNAYLTGDAGSTNFPTTPGASQAASGGSGDAFVTKVNASGSALAYSTYLGGPLPDSGAGIALGADGNAYVTGWNWGSFPTTAGAFQTAFGGGFLDAFVTKLRPFACGEPETGAIIVRKVTAPSPDPTSTSFAFTAGGGLAPTSFSLKNGESRTFANLAPKAGYSLAESTPAGWDLTTATCSDGSPISNIDVGPGETVTCIFTNTKRGSVTLRKTTDGVVDPSKDILFVLTGPGLPTAGVTRSTFGDQDGVLDFGSGNLIPAQTYTICETPVPAGFTSFWKLDGVVVTPYNPDASKTPPEDLGTRCYDFSVSPGQRRAFEVDNSHPGGDPRTIGYWKNWNRCTGGNQSATAQKNGGAAAGFFLVEDLLPQTIGDFSVTSCQQAVKLLSKQDQAGRNKASDAAYELGAQLLAARFNLAAGAETCPAVQQAVLDGQTLLDGINFSGSGDYLGSRSKDPKRAQALALAASLDRYNNGTLC